MKHSEILDFNSNRAIELIKGNKLLAFPTDTVYGVSCRYDKKEAFDNLVKLKKRPPEKPFTVCLYSTNQIEEFGYVNEKIKRVIDKFLPGELTILLKSKDTYPWVKLTSPTIGIRVLGLKEASDFIKKVGPLLLTSVNESGKSPLNSYEEIKESFDGKIDGIIKLDGYSNSFTPSTIVLMIDDEIKLIRQGKILFDDIYKTWKGK